MEKFYKISKQEAELIGKIIYADSQMFDPFCGETEDGFYLVEDSLYDILKNRDEFKNVDFSNKLKLNKEEIQFKQTLIK